MTTLYDCALGGVKLSGLDKSICVTDVREEAPVYRTGFAPGPGEGQQLLRRVRESISVTVRFCVHEAGIARRSQVLHDVYAWAEQGGLLTISDRPGQRLRVVCTALPDISSDDWLAELTLRFTTVHVPWWEDEAAAQVTGTEIMTLAVPGNADFAPVEAIIVNQGTEAIDRITLHCGMTEMVFRDVVFPAGSIFSLMVRDGAVLAWIDGESVLRCRTAQSADMLLLPCGETSTVYADSDETLQATFSVRGRYV